MYKFILAFILCLAFPVNSWAHFGMLLVEPSQVLENDKNVVNIGISFSHPRALQGMDMEKPAAFAVQLDGKQYNLLDTLKPTTFLKQAAWMAGHEIDLPGDYIFYVSPSPYWEPSENRFIVHHTKFILNAHDRQDSWDTAIGLPMEIIPLTRPYGLYPGNSFTGLVLYNGEPLADCKVEIEFYDQSSKYPAANDSLTTQVIKTNAQGYFTCSFPWPGCWGMAALHDGGQITHNNRTAGLEVGGVLWIKVDKLP